MSKQVVITGSTGNLGSAVTEKFTEEGYQVIGTVSPGKLPDEASEGVTYQEVDLTDEEAVRQWSSELEDAASIESVVCLVGGFGMSDLMEADQHSIQKMINLNFFTAFNTVKCLIEKNQPKAPLNIVLVGAKPAIEKRASKGVFAYALSKSMVVSLANAINDASSELNALASVVVPSVIDTPPNRSAMPDANFSDWVTPESLADKIYFLCSEAGRDLRGTTLKVYGNM